MKLKSLIAGSLVAAAIAFPAHAQEWSTAGEQDHPAIYWDEWGVAHITAADDEDAAYALGWAQARGRPDQLVELLVMARGTAASLWGESYLTNDTIIWTAGIPQALPALQDALEPQERAMIDAFAQGINAYFAANPTALSAERRRGLPISSDDVVSHGQSTLYLTFVGGSELFRAQRLRSQASARSEEQEPERGSNGWAIAPSRSESGNAMLLMNPHLPWDGVFTWFEAHVITEGSNTYGVSLLGQPVANIAFTKDLGWTHTVNRLDNADMYAVNMLPGGRYAFDGEERQLDVSAAQLRVRNADGTSRDVTIPIARTIHGPIVATDGARGYALRVAGLGDPAHANAFSQYTAMANASGREEFEAALSRLQNPMFNTIYADRRGEILFVSNGLHPDRTTGDSDMWSGIVDGGTADTLWTQYLPYERLMRVANPPSGFVQNSNETGYTATYPIALDPADYPADFFPPDMRTRPQHGIEMLLGDEEISFDELVEYAHDTRLAFAENVLDDLLRAARTDGRAEAVRAADVLAAWNRRTDADSRGAVLFTFWAETFLQSGNFDYDHRWSFDAPERWSEGIADSAEGAAVDALVAVVARADGAGIPLDLPWGMVARVPDGNGGTLPSSLGVGNHGAFRTGNFTFRSDALVPDFNGGTGWLAAVEFSDTPHARALLPYGNFEQRPEAMKSQYPLYSEGVLREVHFTPEAARAAAVYGEVLTTE